jgi:hypothetical protein
MTEVGVPGLEQTVLFAPDAAAEALQREHPGRVWAASQLAKLLRLVREGIVPRSDLTVILEVKLMTG